MKISEKGVIFLTDTNGGGRLYIKRDLLFLLDINPRERERIEVELLADSDKRELIIKKKPADKTA